MKKLVLLACVSLPLSLLAEGGLPDKPYRAVGSSLNSLIPLKNPTFAEIADFRGIRTAYATPKNSIAGILDDYF